MAEKEVQVVLGKEYRDKYGGFTGVAMGFRELLNGTVQVLIEAPTDKDGKMGERFYIDQGQLVEVATKKPVAKAVAGGATTRARRP